jgi:hypothetical protein
VAAHAAPGGQAGTGGLPRTAGNPACDGLAQMVPLVTALADPAGYHKRDTPHANPHFHKGL